MESSSSVMHLARVSVLCFFLAVELTCQLGNAKGFNIQEERSRQFHKFRPLSRQVRRIDQDLVPFFDNATSRNVTTTSGKTAYLPCRVRHLGDRTVSWIRRRDLHVLTVGRFTYTSDQRFQTIHLEQSDDWTLQVKYPQSRDAGVYECQLSTVPKMSHFVSLNVIDFVPPGIPTQQISDITWTAAVPLKNSGSSDFMFETGSLWTDTSVATGTDWLQRSPSTQTREKSKAKIIGGPTLYINSGSTINLTCVVLESPVPPDYVFWYHNGKVINYDSPRGISVHTEKAARTLSKLLVSSARPTDSGNYSCVPSNAEPAAIALHVLNGEHPAAMQHGKHTSSAPGLPTSWNILLVLLMSYALLLYNKR